MFSTQQQAVDLFVPCPKRLLCDKRHVIFTESNYYFLGRKITDKTGVSRFYRIDWLWAYIRSEVSRQRCNAVILTSVGLHQAAYGNKKKSTKARRNYIRQCLQLLPFFDSSRVIEFKEKSVLNERGIPNFGLSPTSLRCKQLKGADAVVRLKEAAGLFPEGHEKEPCPCACPLYGNCVTGHSHWLVIVPTSLLGVLHSESTIYRKVADYPNEPIYFYKKFYAVTVQNNSQISAYRYVSPHVTQLFARAAGLSVSQTLLMGGLWFHRTFRKTKDKTSLIVHKSNEAICPDATQDWVSVNGNYSLLTNKQYLTVRQRMIAGRYRSRKELNHYPTSSLKKVLRKYLADFVKLESLFGFSGYFVTPSGQRLLSSTVLKYFDETPTTPELMFKLLNLRQFVFFPVDFENKFRERLFELAGFDVQKVLYGASNEVLARFRNNDNLPELTRKYMLQYKVTGKKLALHLGVSAVSISLFLNRKVKMRNKTREKLLVLLSQHVDISGRCLLD